MNMNDRIAIKRLEKLSNESKIKSGLLLAYHLYRK